MPEGDRKGFRRAAALLTSVAACLFLPATASAAVVTPNTTTDEYDTIPDGTCSLREAVETLTPPSGDFGGCTHSGTFGTADTVQLATGTYLLSLDPAGPNLNDVGDLNTFSDMTIAAAPGAAPTISAAGNNDRILAASVLGVTVTLQGLTLTGGSPSGSGGAIFSSSGTGLVISDSTISGNTTGPTGAGGGIQANGPTTLTNVSVTGNTTATSGGGIALNDPGSLTVNGTSHVDGNHATGPNSDGGGIWHTSDGNVTLNPGVTVDGNDAKGFAGGLFVSGNATLTINGASVSDNQLAENGTQQAIGSGLSSSTQSAAISNATIDGNDSVGDSAGPAVDLFAVNSVLIDSTSISGNTATGQDDADSDVVFPAGIRMNDNAGVTIANSTIAGNTVTGADSQDPIFGGGIYTVTPLTITGSTVALNSVGAGSASSRGGAGLYLDAGSTSEIGILNSTFTGNDAGTGAGGAINVQLNGHLTVGQSTFSGNMSQIPQGAAINTQGQFGGGTAVLTLRGTIFTEGAAACSFGGGQTLNANRFNVDAADSCVGATDDTDYENTLASLGALADNGGPTETKALLGPSNLFNGAGACTQLNGSTPLLVDQRGAPRPTEGACEPGAYERFFCDGVLFNGPGPIVCPAPGTTTGGGTTEPGPTTQPLVPPPDPCPPLRKKLRKAKQQLRAARNAGEPIAKPQSRVRKLKKKLRALGCL